jgi:hypothetical protein
MIKALLIFFIQDPCCSISVTKFDNAVECNAAWAAVEERMKWARKFSNDAWPDIIMQGCTYYVIPEEE